MREVFYSISMIFLGMMIATIISIIVVAFGMFAAKILINIWQENSMIKVMTQKEIKQIEKEEFDALVTRIVTEQQEVIDDILREYKMDGDKCDTK